MPTGSYQGPPDPELLVATFGVDGGVVFRNDAWQATLGLGAGIWERLSVEDRDLARQFLAEAATGSLVTNQVLPVFIPHRDQPLHVLLNFLPVRMRASGPEVGAVMVTGELLAEPASWTVSQTQRHRMESLGRMTMGIAHDFNNLLSGILGYAELMKSSVASGEPDPAFADHLRTIEQAALDGAALVRKIQQYIRQEKQTSFEPLDLPTVVSDSVALTRPYWFNEPRRKGISIQTRMDLRDVPPVMGSATELREVFVNLILNAVQAMPHGGVITFTTAYSAEGGVVVSVADTGLGMNERVKARIFEPLFTTKGEQGTGMGLAVSYGIIQEHEATITVETALGKGTRFDLAFPAASGALPEAEAGPEPASGMKARVLIVDDDRMVRTVLSRLLTLKEHHVRQASSGREALEMASAEPFDIVITDQGMPEMSGRQLARQLRRSFPTLPIVLLTGDTEVGEADEEIDCVLSKPFQLDVLESTIQQMLDRSLLTK